MLGTSEFRESLSPACIFVLLPLDYVLRCITLNHAIYFRFRLLTDIVTHMNEGHHTRSVDKRRDSWHIYVIIFHIFPVLVKLNVRSRKGCNTLGLQPGPHKFDVINKEEEGKGVFPNLCTCANLPRRQG